MDRFSTDLGLDCQCNKFLTVSQSTMEDINYILLGTGIFSQNTVDMGIAVFE